MAAAIRGQRPTRSVQHLVLDGKTYTVAGIAPSDARVDDDDVDVFTLLGQNGAPALQNRRAHPGIDVVGRLRPGASH